MWDLQDVSAWTSILDETRGLREKRWVEDPADRTWLLKFPRVQSLPGGLSLRGWEPATEVFALALARAVGVEAAMALPASDGARRAIVVSKFTAGRRVLHLGSQLIKGIEPTYSPSNHAEHTLAAVRAALRSASQPASNLVSLARMLCFDAWIGNCDRHQDNWGVLADEAGDKVLAPMFDPAACLGAELQKGHALLEANPPSALVDRYVRRCPSGFGDGIALIAMPRVVAELRASWPEWSAGVDGWLDDFHRALREDVPSLLREIPPDWWSDERRQLAATLLERRLDWLRKEAHGG